MAILNVQMIEESGSYVGKPVKKTIEWSVKDKKYSADIFVKLASYETTVAEFVANKETGSPMVSRIVSSVVDEKGNPIFKVENVMGNPETGEGQMCSSLFMALVSAINQANGFVDDGNEEIKGKN